MARVLVLGEAQWRERLTSQLEETPAAEVVECDSALGDCVMYVRLEGLRFDAFFFAGFDHPVTRGALAIVAERAVLIPLLDGDRARPSVSHDGYLFCLPQALAFRDEAERHAVLRAVPEAAAVPSVLVGRDALEPQALTPLIEHATARDWRWDVFVAGVRHDVERGR